MNRFHLAVVAVWSTCTHAAPIVKNADFTQRLSHDAGLPANWAVPKGSPWHSTNADGHSGQDSLRYRSRASGSAGPVTQAIVLPANADLVFAISVKSDRALRPLARVKAAGEQGVELVRILPEASGAPWTRYTSRFSSGQVTAAVVEIWADARHLQGRRSPGGTVAIDDVQVIPADEAEAVLTPRSGVVNYENVARGKPYTLQPPPGYRYCTEAGDRIQLTDGQYTVGYFWTQKTTVGWSRARPVVVTVDLGADYAIQGLSYNTAAGVAGVEWPASITVLVSVDGRGFHLLGDLVALSNRRAPPPKEGYAVHRFHTDELKAHGRYVKLLIDAAGPYCFIDEIEVHRGADEWKQLPLPGDEIRYPMEYFRESIFNATLKRRIGTDLEAAHAALVEAGLPTEVTARLHAEIAATEQAIAELPEVDSKDFRATFPLNAVHARAYAALGAVRAAKGLPAVAAWRANPWDFIEPTELPTDPPPARIVVAAMNGETRAGAVNLTNCTNRPFRARLTFDGIPGSPAPNYVAVHEVAWTDTREGTPVAAALPEAASTDGAYPIHLPAGMTRQVWLSVTPRGLPAGSHSGHVVVAGATSEPLRIPFTLRIFAVDLPARPRLHVGGWDYTNVSAMYGVTPKNRAALIAHLQSRFVDSPWATRGVMPYGTFDAAGELAREPDTTRFDAWISRWPDARRYCVFNSVRDDIAGTKLDDPLFPKMVGNWIRFWAEYVRTRDIDPGQLCLLLVDEPHSHEKDRIIVAWARAIEAVEPKVVIWEDPTYSKPEEALPEMMSIADVLCPNRPMMLREGQPFMDFYRKQRAAGRRLDFYSCSGPARLLDPYSYHRLQAWTCFQMGAESTFFWAFGDNGGGDSWNEYVSKRTSFTPLFLGRDSVTPGKHMEAIRESVEDFEYLSMLRDRIAAVENRQPIHALLTQAKKLLAGAADRVLLAEDASELEWRAPKDRSVADLVRVEIGEMLEKLN